MPNVVLEAMASSRPVLASSCEGVAELLGPEAPAQTAPFGDRAAWLAQLGRLLGNPVRRREIGAQNRLRAEHEFSLGSMIGAYEALWAEVAQRSA
jgi:glycosyltransferase involved in cell wall biosynthesis